MFGRNAPAAEAPLPPRRHALRWVLAAGAIVAALAGVLAGALLLVNGDTAKAAIERQLAELTGGDFRYATLELKAWPRPTAELRQVSFRIAPVVEGTAERMTVRFALLRLLAGEVHVSRVLLDRPALVLRPPATGPVSIPDDPVAAWRAAVGPAIGWLSVHARDLALSVHDGTIDIDMPGGSPLKLDEVTLDGRVAADAVEAKIAAHGTLFQGARLHASISTGSLAATAELEFDGLDAASAFARVLDAATVGLHPGSTDLKLTLSTDGERSADASLTFATPALAVARNGARLELGAARARITASYAPGDTTLRVEELKLGETLSGATATLKVKPGAGGVTLDAALGRVDAGRLRAAALALASDVALVGAVSSIVKSGTAVDVKVHAVADRVPGLADVSAYDVAMGVESAALDIPVPVMTLTGASGKVRIARGVLTASNVAGTFDGSSLRSGELVLALAPAVAISSLSVGLDLDLAESHQRVLRMLRDSPLAREMDRVESIAGRAKGTLTLKQDGGTLRQIYDVTSLNAKLRYTRMPLPVAVDGGGVHYETGGTLVLRKVRGTIGASRVQELDAEVAFAPRPVVRSGSGEATLALEELYRSAIAFPAFERLRGEVGALQGSVGVKLTRLAGSLTTPDRLEVDAVLTPRTVRATSPRLPGTLTIDDGTIRLQNQDLLCDGVDVAVRDVRGTLSGSFRGWATAAPALDVVIARATVGPRGLEWFGNEADLAQGARLLAPIRLERTRVRWPAPAPWRLEVAGAASLSGGARSEFDFSYRSGSVEIRRLTLKDQDSDARATLDWRPERAGVAFHGLVSGRSMARILASLPAASGTLRGDFEATVDLTEPMRSRATGKLEGVGVGLPDMLDFPLAIERMTLEADGERVRVRDTSLRLADQPLQLEGSIGRAGDGLLVDGTVTTDAIDVQRWLDRLPRGAADPAGAAGASGRPWPVHGRLALRAGRVDVLGYRVEPFAANVSLDERKLAAEVTVARLCGIEIPFTLTASGSVIDVKGRASARDLPVAAAVACLSKGSISASGTMDVTADFAANGTAATLPASARGSMQLRARDGRVGGVTAISGVLDLDEVNQRLPRPERESIRDGMSYLTLEIDARLERERAILDRVLLEGTALNIAMQGEIGVVDRKVALTGIALPLANVNALLRRVPIVGRAIGDPIVGIPFSVGGDVGNPQVSRIGPAAVAGALVGTLQSVVSLPVQLLGVGGDTRTGDGAAPAPPPSGKP